MMMYYCHIEDIFEGIFDSKEKCIEAVKKRFSTLDWTGEKPILKEIVENTYERDELIPPVIVILYVKWEGIEELVDYEIVGCNVNTTYSS